MAKTVLVEGPTGAKTQCLEGVSGALTLWTPLAEMNRLFIAIDIV
jgi:hypothetical protein